ncbi:MAG: class I SAM-dependent methyltransferase [Porticoccaceae bacterium]
MKYDAARPEYYQRLHNENAAFQRNNWLVEELPLLRQMGGESILEVGCGNGRFLAAAAPHWKEVVGLDWARSPVIADVLKGTPNVSFVQVDVSTWKPDRLFDLVISADFLEHLPPDILPGVLPRIARFGRRNFHKIACYDDGHSHLSILAPEVWLGGFREAAPEYDWSIVSRTARKGDQSKQVVNIIGQPRNC